MAEKSIQVFSTINKSVHFIIPMIGVPRFNSLINCYLGDNTKHPELNFKGIFLHTSAVESALVSNPYYYLSYELDDGTYMFVFKIPTHYEKDYLLFCEGKYSQFSDDYKARLCSMQTVSPLINSDVYQIIYKTPKKRQSIEDKIGMKLLDSEEVCSIPDLDKEIYDTEDKR